MISTVLIRARKVSWQICPADFHFRIRQRLISTSAHSWEYVKSVLLGVDPRLRREISGPAQLYIVGDFLNFRHAICSMSSLDVMLQALFGIFAVLGIFASLHYRESLCCVWLNVTNRHQRVQCPITSLWVLKNRLRRSRFRTRYNARIDTKRNVS
jgi:hypothetical protein